jgi:hypothetical protein
MSRIAFSGLIITLLAVMITSGCTTDTQTGSGIVIQEFAPDFSSVYPEEIVTFNIKFKNMGSVDANNVFARLIGLDKDWESSGAGSSIIDSGNMDASCQHTGKFALRAPDPAHKTEGETSTCTWKLRAPDIPTGMKPKYDVTARVFYDYETTIIKSFTILSSEELAKYNQQKKTLPSSTVSSTRSPIKITAKSMDPIRFWENDKISFPLAITVSNSGGGIVCLRGKCTKDSSSDLEWDKLKLKIESKSKDLNIAPVCSEFASGGTIEVWPKKDNTIVCDIEVSGVSNIVGYQQKMLQITAEYSYFIDKKSSITIL